MFWVPIAAWLALGSKEASHIFLLGKRETTTEIRKVGGKRDVARWQVGPRRERREEKERLAAGHGVELQKEGKTGRLFHKLR